MSLWKNEDKKYERWSEEAYKIFSLKLKWIINL